MLQAVVNLQVDVDVLCHKETPLQVLSVLADSSEYIQVRVMEPL